MKLATCIYQHAVGVTCWVSLVSGVARSSFMLSSPEIKYKNTVQAPHLYLYRTKPNYCSLLFMLIWQQKVSKQDACSMKNVSMIWPKKKEQEKQ